MKQIILLYSLLLPYCIAFKNDTGLIIASSYDPTKPPRLSEKALFANLILDSDILVDKTLLIRDVMEDAGKTFIINCPHRWGKSVNLDMIKVFLRIQNNGDQFRNKSVTSTPTYRLFVQGELEDHKGKKKLKTPPLISKHQDFIDEHLGRWPVIYLNFKFDGKMYNDMKTDIIYAIQMAYDSNAEALGTFYEIIRDNYTDPETRAEAERYIDKFREISFFDSNRTDQDIKMSIHFLSEIMYIHYRKKVIVLIDDYFSPWKQIFALSKFGIKKKSLFLDFYADIFLNAFKSNEYIEKGIITGVAPIMEELRVYAFDELIECNMLTGKFMQYYGFTRYDVSRLSGFLNISKNTQGAFWYWYNGHRAINTNTTLQIYAPWSIMNYLNSRKYTHYWFDKSGEIAFFVSNLLQLYSFKQRFNALINGSEIIVKWDQQYFTWADYEYVLEAMFSIIGTDNTFADKSFMMLHSLGYLALRENYTITFSATYYRMKFPNTEVSYQMKKLLRDLNKGPKLKFSELFTAQKH